MATAMRQPRYDEEELGQRGDEIYERDIAPKLKPEDRGKFVAIDVETGDYEVASQELTACDTLSSRLPEARIWLRRIGSRHLYRFGSYQTSAA